MHACTCQQTLLLAIFLGDKLTRTSVTDYKQASVKQGASAIPWLKGTGMLVQQSSCLMYNFW